MQRHLVQLLAIRILIPNSDIQIHRAFLNKKTKKNYHFVTYPYCATNTLEPKATPVRYPLRNLQHRGALIVPLPMDE
jgi:hypothetical protein